MEVALQICISTFRIAKNISNVNATTFTAKSHNVDVVRIHFMKMKLQKNGA